MEDRHTIGGWPLRSLAIELVVEDRAHRAVSQGADLDRPRGGGFEAIGAEWPHRRTMPRQARKPCSGWGRRSRISSHSAAVAGPIEAASRRMRSTVQLAYRRWLDGMCSGTVVCRWLLLARR